MRGGRHFPGAGGRGTLAVVLFWAQIACAADALRPLWVRPVPAGIEWTELRADRKALLVCDRAEKIAYVRLADGEVRGTLSGHPGTATAGGDGSQVLLFDRYQVQLLDWPDSGATPRIIWSRGEWPAPDAEDDDPEFLVANVTAALGRDSVYVYRSDGRLGRFQRSDGAARETREIGKLVDARLSAERPGPVLLTGRQGGETIAYVWQDGDPFVAARLVKVGTPLWVGACSAGIVSVSRDAVHVSPAARDQLLPLPGDFRPAASTITLRCSAARDCTLVLGGATGGVIAFDLATGNQRFRSTRPGDIAWVTTENEYAIVGGDGFCNALDLADGRNAAHLAAGGDCRAAIIRSRALIAIFARTRDAEGVELTLTSTPLSGAGSQPAATQQSAPPPISMPLGLFDGPIDVLCTAERLLIVERTAVKAFAWPSAEPKP